MISSAELDLVAVEIFHKQALRRGKPELAALLGVAVPDGWPHFPQAFAIPQDEPDAPSPPRSIWSGYFFVHAPERALIGNGGFKGPPDDAGCVEIGYEIASQHWNRGFATAAAKALLRRAFAHASVSAVEACTLAETNASNTVLRKIGMSFVEELPDSSVGAVWRWRISAEQYRA